MFESIILRRAEGHSAISFGQIAEALLYYQKVHIFFDRGTLFGLIEQIGTNRLLTLLDRPEISAVYCEEMLCTASDSSGISSYYQYVVTVYTGDQKEGRLRPLQERLEQELKLKGRPEPEAMRFSRAFVKKVPKRSFIGNHFIPEGIIKSTQCDLSDTEYTNKAIHDIIAIVPGGYTAGVDFKFKVIDTEIGMFVDSNIKLELINQKRAELIPHVEPLTIAQLLSYLMDARADLILASFYGGDFITSAVSSSAIQSQCTGLLKRSNAHADMRLEFEDIFLPNSPSLAEVIDSGERSFDEFLNFLDRTPKFKKWLKGLDPEERFIHAYLHEINTDPLIRSTPIKTIRYILTVVAGLMHPAAGMGAGAINDFAVEKIFTGWRPNHFVSNTLSPFVQGKDF